MCPGLVEVSRQPVVKLLNGIVLRSDFKLVYTQPPHRNIRLIECQSRTKSDHAIVQKIQRMRAVSQHNRFILVYEDPSYLSAPVLHDLETDGIVHYSFEEFLVFAVQLGKSLLLTAPMARATVAGGLADYLKSDRAVRAAFQVNSDFTGIDGHGRLGVKIPSEVKHKDEGMLSSPPPPRIF